MIAVCLVALSSCSMTRPGVVLLPGLSEEQLPPLSEVDLEVRSVLSSQASYNLENLNGHRVTFGERWEPYRTLVAGWGPGHFAALLRYLVTLDPRSTVNGHVLHHGCSECLDLSARLAETDRPALRDAFVSSRFIAWLDDAHATLGRSRDRFWNEGLMNRVAVLGLELGSEEREPLLLKILGRGGQDGWQDSSRVWFSYVEGAKPPLIPSLALVRGFAAAIVAVEGDPELRRYHCLGSHYQADRCVDWWTHAADAETRNALLSLYLCMPSAESNLDGIDGSKNAQQPPGSGHLNQLLYASDSAEYAAAFAFISAVLVATDRLDKEFIEFCCRRTSLARRLLHADIRKSFRDGLETAFAEAVLKRQTFWEGEK
jgi:hypothetical protein